MTSSEPVLFTRQVLEVSLDPPEREMLARLARHLTIAEDEVLVALIREKYQDLLRSGDLVGGVA